MSGALDRSHEVPIPAPPEHWFLGNLPDVDPSFMASSLWRLTDLYGEIYSLNLINRKTIVIGSYDLYKTVQSDELFEKNIDGSLLQVRAALKDGLFTAFPGEPNWGKAHRLLMAVFGPLAVRKMWPDMKSIADQMVARWERMGDGCEIDGADDFTRLAFDTIGKAGFSYDFFQFYQEHVHPFATAMAETLTEAGRIANRTQLETTLRIWSAQHLKENIAIMHDLVDKIIVDRKARPQPNRHDLLNVMLNEADPVTGEKLSDENIRYNLVTFLVAGHETTAGTLAFLIYHFLNNPDKMMKAQDEVDRVVGNEEVDIKHLSSLKYVDACIKEVLRFLGPITFSNRRAKQDVMLGEKYFIPKGQPVFSSLRALHHDPAVWGDDHDVFKPERMLDMSKIPPGAWKPFGTGERSCIGRAFAEQEMIGVVATILQKYQIAPAVPDYKLQLKSTLTVKPLNFKFKLFKRQKNIIPGSVSAPTAPAATTSASNAVSTAHGNPMTVYYGSNAGTCKAFAEELQAAAPSWGYVAEIKPLDEAVESMPTDRPVAIVTASYEGRPTDNAKKFVAWLEGSKAQQKSDMLKGVQFSVCGIGNSEWQATYQRIPKLVNELMLGLGAKHVAEPVYTDIKETAIGDFEAWLAKFRDGIGASSDMAASGKKPMSMSVVKSGGPGILGQPDMSFGIIRETRQLADNSVGPCKMHTSIELPRGASYQSGDYLVVLPYNHPSTTHRVLARFELHADDTIHITDTTKKHLMTETPMSAFEFFSTRAELNNIITQGQLEHLIERTVDAAPKAGLEAILKSYKAEVLPKRLSVLDVLEDFPACHIELVDYVDMLKPLAPRQYSISSSPYASFDKEYSEHAGPVATVTYDVHSAPAFSGKGRTFNGVASSYLSRANIGSRIHCHVRSTNAAFHLPRDPKTPVILIAAGSGLAPMRGFIQDREAIAAARGVDALGPALFYFGCRDFEKDFIYADELRAWEAKGLIKVRPAFSQRGPPGATNYKYVPERMLAEKEELRALYKEGAKLFLCGSAGKLAKSTTDVLKKIYMEGHPEISDEEASKWLDSVRETRYVSDVFD